MGAKYFSIHTFHSNLNTNVPEGDEKSTVIVKTCQGHNRNILSIAKDPYQTHWISKFSSNVSLWWINTLKAWEEIW